MVAGDLKQELFELRGLVHASAAQDEALRNEISVLRNKVAEKRSFMQVVPESKALKEGMHQASLMWSAVTMKMLRNRNKDNEA
jgi:hypothetical protein